MKVSDSVISSRMVRVRIHLYSNEAVRLGVKRRPRSARIAGLGASVTRSNVPDREAIDRILVGEEACVRRIICTAPLFHSGVVHYRGLNGGYMLASVDSNP